MPELPDVQVFRQYFNATVLNKKVAEVDVLDDEILVNMSSRSFQMRMKGETFQATMGSIGSFSWTGKKPL
jgi:formamidopyrimidine-DNA glycosylase